MDKKLIFNEHGERGTQSMIGGNTTNLREWNRIKYDWANQMYRTMLNNFWIPEEISLNEDVKQFPYLTDYERRAFDKIIAFLNFLDSIQSENLPNLSRYITASEVASLLNIQAFQEEIHAQSYSYILDTVTNPITRDKIYDEWRTDKTLLARNRFIADAYQRFSDDPSEANLIHTIIANYILEDKNNKDSKSNNNQEDKFTGLKSIDLSNHRNLSYSLSKNLATLGSGNIEIADKENSDDLTRLNRDTTKLTKDLVNTSISSNVDASIDARVLTKSGQKDIKDEFNTATAITKALNAIIETGEFNFNSEVKENVAQYEAGKLLGNELAQKLTDDSGDALWKDQCIELVNRCIGELQDPCMTILRCFYYHNFRFYWCIFVAIYHITCYGTC